jgi:hypothetical protein
VTAASPIAVPVVDVQAQRRFPLAGHRWSQHKSARTSVGALGLYDLVGASAAPTLAYAAHVSRATSSRSVGSQW